MPRLPTPGLVDPLPLAAQTGILLERAKHAHRTGLRQEAMRLFRRIVSADALNAEAAGLLGVVLMEDSQLEPALEQFENALRIDPNQARIWLFRGMALADTGRFPDALACFDRVLLLEPGNDVAHVNRAATLFRCGRFEEAKAVSEALVKRLPDDPGMAGGHALMLQWAGKFEEALEEYDRAIALDPTDAVAHANKGIFQLYLGQFEAGFREYEWRWRRPEIDAPDRTFDRPLWLGGSDIAGKTVLFHHEQGFGDTIQFCRYAMLAAKAGARVILHVQEALAELMRSLPGVSQIIAGEAAFPEHDLHCPMVSLPLAFGTTLETIPNETPYLRAEKARVAEWRQRLSGLPGPRIGLVWGGSSRFGNAELVSTDLRRSMPLMALAPLATMAGCSFVSLQLGPPASQTKFPPAGMILHDHTAALHDFADTAALIENLDLVISVDTAVAHLAGAMGKPVWLMNRYDTCWRWLRDRDDSPWYPTLRQFRQTTPGNWADVADRIATALHAFVTVNSGLDQPRSGEREAG